MFKFGLGFVAGALLFGTISVSADSPEYYHRAIGRGMAYTANYILLNGQRAAREMSACSSNPDRMRLYERAGRLWADDVNAEPDEAIAVIRSCGFNYVRP